jgi:hypothetical protein
MCSGRCSSLAVFLSMAALCAGSAGCSFIFVRGPPSQPRQTRVVDCTTSRVAPVLDTIFGGLEAVRTGVALAASDANYQNTSINRSADIGLGLAFTGLFVGSAVYGYIETGRCDDIKTKSESTESSDEESSKSKPSSTPTTAPATSSALQTTEPAAREPKLFDNRAARAAIEKAMAVAATSCHSKEAVPVRGEANADLWDRRARIECGVGAVAPRCHRRRLHSKCIARSKRPALRRRPCGRQEALRPKPQIAAGK